MNQLVLRGFKPDPSICKAGNDYFLVTSSFEFFPSIPIFHSKDLINWEFIGYCLDRPSQVNLDNVKNSQGIFAPTIRYHEGVFYLVCTNVGGGGNFLVKTENPFKGWSDPLYLSDWPGIDPSLYFEDGKAYIHGTRGWEIEEESGIYLAEIDLNTGNLIGNRKHIWTGTGATDPEGPHIYKKDNKYYLLISEGGTEYGHMLTIARSENIFGPYESYDNNPILTNRSLRNPIQAVGHGDLVEYENQWVLFFLGFRCIRYPKQHNLGRETFSCSVLWENEGWPLISDTSNFQLYDSEKEMLNSRQPCIFLDEFRNKRISSFWQYIRIPHMENYVIEDEKLCLKGTSATLNNSFGLTFLGIPQTEYDFYAEVSLDLKDSELVEMGLTTYVNDDFHYDLFVECEYHISLKLRTTIGDIHVADELALISDEEITVFVKGTPDYYYFGYIDKDCEREVLSRRQTRLLSTEVSGGFTGTMIGIYVSNVNKKECNGGVGKFNSFKYQVEE